MKMIVFLLLVSWSCARHFKTYSNIFKLTKNLNSIYNRFTNAIPSESTDIQDLRKEGLDVYKKAFESSQLLLSTSTHELLDDLFHQTEEVELSPGELLDAFALEEKYKDASFKHNRFQPEVVDLNNQLVNITSKFLNDTKNTFNAIEFLRNFPRYVNPAFDLLRANYTVATSQRNPEDLANLDDELDRLFTGYKYDIDRHVEILKDSGKLTRIRGQLMQKVLTLERMSNEIVSSVRKLGSIVFVLMISLLVL